MFLLIVLSVIALTIVPTAISDDVNTIVETNSGPVRGKLFETLFDRRPYYAFKGIPYAEPPVGKLRFKVCDSVVYWIAYLLYICAK